MKKKIVFSVLGFVLLLLVFNFTMFLGLQVSTTLGNIGLVVSAALFALWIYYVIKK